MFPRKINGEYVMFSRPSDSGHTPFGDMYLSRSKDMVYWGRHRHVMAPDKGWESKKIGAGPIPIETSEGWLVSLVQPTPMVGFQPYALHHVIQYLSSIHTQRGSYPYCQGLAFAVSCSERYFPMCRAVR